MPVSDGLSRRAQYDIHHLERTRNYLHPGDVGLAVHRWKAYLHRPERLVWRDDEWDGTHWYCCGDPFAARALLDAVVRALPRRSGRELRAVVERLDAL